MKGRPPEITDADILSVFEESSDPVLSSPEVAEEFGYTTAGIYKRLRELNEKGHLGTKKIGQGRAWWITEQGRDLLSKSNL
ncbi:HTH domain protein [Haloferax gibbonsii]|uniref:HTH domain protein n=1 Tax=Haloferax gibbonsii TaxID=35746 RepID=A0A871BJ55_HALGI|nr:HTH domain protein [Haloferax gibbonsii]